jgi:hypothetical protein
MYLQLAGPSPLDTAENPLAPGAKTYSYDAMYLGQGPQIVLPDALYPPNVEGYAAALKALSALYEKIIAGRKKDPAEAAQTGMAAAITIKAIIAFIKAVIPIILALSVAARAALALLARQRITELYNANTYDVRNLNNMNAQTVGQKIAQIDRDIEATSKFSVGKTMALARFRLVYQQRFDNLTAGGGVFGVFGGLSIPLAIGVAVGAYLLISRRK